MNNARYAYSKSIDGTEKAYMVEVALDDLVAAYREDDIAAISCAKASLAQDDEDERQRLMALALGDVVSRLASYGRRRP